MGDTAACNGTIVVDQDMGEVIQLQGDQRKDVQEFLTSKEYLELDPKTIKVIMTALSLSLAHELFEINVSCAC
jgi:translation initiation factor SUI1